MTVPPLRTLFRHCGFAQPPGSLSGHAVLYPAVGTLLSASLVLGYQQTPCRRSTRMVRQPSLAKDRHYDGCCQWVLPHVHIRQGSPLMTGHEPCSERFSKPPLGRMLWNRMAVAARQQQQGQGSSAEGLAGSCTCKLSSCSANIPNEPGVLRC